MGSLWLFCSLVWMSGCATVFTGTKEDVTFESEPSDAKVMVDGTNRGRTPLTLSLRKKNSYTIAFQKDCWRSREDLYVTRTMQMGWAIADWAMGPLLIPLGVDWLTGAWYTFDKNRLDVDLVNTCEGESGSNGEGEQATDCSENEQCDGKDNDCDGVVDEGC